MSSDATRCAVCGGEFSSKRVVVDGRAMHQGCAVMSYTSHTPDDMARMGAKIRRLENEIKLLRQRLEVSEAVNKAKTEKLIDLGVTQV